MLVMPEDLTRSPVNKISQTSPSSAKRKGYGMIMEMLTEKVQPKGGKDYLLMFGGMTHGHGCSGGRIIFGNSYPAMFCGPFHHIIGPKGDFRFVFVVLCFIILSGLRVLVGDMNT